MIELSVSGTDPLGETIEFSFLPNPGLRDCVWERTRDFTLVLDVGHVGDVLWLAIAVRSQRAFHAQREVFFGKVDDVVKFGYEVLPPRLLPT